MKLIPVKFLKSKVPYNATEIAGFPEDTVRDLVRKGIAELVNKDDLDIETLKADKKLINSNIVSGEFKALLEGTKAEIVEKIAAKNEHGDFIIGDNDLGRMLNEERLDKARKNVLKAIENEAFGRLTSTS